MNRLPNDGKLETFNDFCSVSTRSTHTVFRLVHRNGFDGLQALTESILEPGRHELLIKVRTVAFNYRGAAIARSQYPFSVKDNVTTCSDAMGEVVEVGSSVPGFDKGDRVAVAFDPTALSGTIDNLNNGLGGQVDGALSHYKCIPHQGVVKLPTESVIKDEQWAAVARSGVTPLGVLYGNIPLRLGQTVLFQGIRGMSVTGLALAKAAGARTIITSSSDEDLDYVQSRFGADQIINYKKTLDWATVATMMWESISSLKPAHLGPSSSPLRPSSTALASLQLAS